jgi:hypothetical protein
VPQEAERRAEHDRGEDRRVRLVERERDHGEREAGDRGDSCGEPVEPVDEVDHVHDRHDPEHRQRDPQRLRELPDAERGEREVVDPDPEGHGDDRGRDLTAELLPPREPADVVDHADDRRERRADQEAARLVAEPQERERRHEDAHEEREPAEPRDRDDVQPPSVRLVDRADPPGHPADRGGQEDDDRERGDAAVEDLQMV